MAKRQDTKIKTNCMHCNSVLRQDLTLSRSKCDECSSYVSAFILHYSTVNARTIRHDGIKSTHPAVFGGLQLQYSDLVRTRGGVKGEGDPETGSRLPTIYAPPVSALDRPPNFNAFRKKRTFERLQKPLSSK